MPEQTIQDLPQEFQTHVRQMYDDYAIGQQMKFQEDLKRIEEEHKSRLAQVQEQVVAEGKKLSIAQEALRAIQAQIAADEQKAFDQRTKFVQEEKEQTDRLSLAQHAVRVTKESIDVLAKERDEVSLAVSIAQRTKDQLAAQVSAAQENLRSIHAQIYAIETKFKEKEEQQNLAIAALNQTSAELSRAIADKVAERNREESNVRVLLARVADIYVQIAEAEKQYAEKRAKIASLTDISDELVKKRSILEQFERNLNEKKILLDGQEAQLNVLRKQLVAKENALKQMQVNI